jgi:DNA polymerase-1
LSADYSQIELRIIAAMSGDAGLKEAFAQGQDIHAATAAKIYDVSVDAVTREMRSKAKMVNFGIPYGITPFGLAQRLGSNREEASNLISQYFNRFPSVREFIDDTLAFARRNGYVETMTGRRRYVRDVNSRNMTTRMGAERNAINMPVQGTAADMIKIAMSRVHLALAKAGHSTKLLLQVHDELVFEAPKTEIKIVEPIIRDAMTNALPMDVPIEVEIGHGQNWLDAH